MHVHISMLLHIMRHQESDSDKRKDRKNYDCYNYCQDYRLGVPLLTH